MPKDEIDQPKIPENVRKAELGAIDGPYRPMMMPVGKPIERPAGSNADEWLLFLSYWLDSRVINPHGLVYVAVQIVEAIDATTRAEPAPSSRAVAEALKKRADWLRDERLRGGDSQHLLAREGECRWLAEQAAKGAGPFAAPPGLSQRGLNPLQ